MSYTKINEIFTFGKGTFLFSVFLAVVKKFTVFTEPLLSVCNPHQDAGWNLDDLVASPATDVHRRQVILEDAHGAELFLSLDHLKEALKKRSKKLLLWGGQIFLKNLTFLRP